MIKAVIFDLGFTLVGHKDFTIPKYLDLIDKGINNVINYLVEIGILKKENARKFARKFKKIKYMAFDKSFDDLVEYSTEYCLTKTFEEFKIKDNDLVNKCAGIFHAIEAEFWAPFPNTKPTLEKLKAMGLKVALLSNGPYDKGIKKLLEILELKDYFDLIETSANIGYTKPNPLTFNTILKKLNLKPEEVIMVGDDLLNDCKGASDVGLLCVKVKKDFNFPYEVGLKFKPDFTINDISEVPDIIKQINEI
ncbi:MAG: HAD family hydrolase [Candidatus Helarchaeota archaeon]